MMVDEFVASATVAAVAKKTHHPPMRRSRYLLPCRAEKGTRAEAREKATRENTSAIVSAFSVEVEVQAVGAGA